MKRSRRGCLLSSEIPSSWLVIGFLAQTLFFSRFLVQWLYSERLGRSAMPTAFWYLSLGGGAMLLCYAIHREDPVIIVGQVFGVVVYGRNLWLIHAPRGRTRSLDTESS